MTKVLFIKFIVSLIAFTIGLDLFFDASISDILSFSVTATIISYVLADRILLPRIGNTNTLMVEFILMYAIVWLFGSILLNGYLQIAWGSAIAAIIVTGSEVLVHRFLLKQMPDAKKVKKHQRRFRPQLKYATEFAEEQDTKPRPKGKK